MDKKVLHLCEKCMSDYERYDATYETSWVDEQLLERDLLKRENEQIKLLLEHYKTIVEKG